MNVIDGNISIAEIANFAVAFAIVAATVIAIFYIAKGGFTFITSGGDDKKIEAAMHTVRYAIVGLVVVFMSVLVIKIVGAVFDFDFLSYLSFEKIKGMTQIIMNRMRSVPSAGGVDGSSSMQGVLD